MAVGWRQAAKPGELFVAFSTDGGHSFQKQNGTMRQFRVAGEGTRGLSLDICGGRIWVGTVVNYPGDDPADKDVLLTSRTIGGQAGQAFLTDAAGDRTARQVSVACVGNRLLAVAWVENAFGKGRAKLMIRSLEPLGEPTSVRRVFGLGEALPQGGIAVDASTDSVHVAWAAGQKENVFYEGFLVGDGADPPITRSGSVKLAAGDALYPQVAARGKKVVVVYTESGKVKARVSGDTGTTVRRAQPRGRQGSRGAPSQAHSVDVQRLAHRRRGHGQRCRRRHPAAHLLERLGCHLDGARLRARGGARRRAAQDERDVVPARRGLAEQRAGHRHPAGAIRATLRACWSIVDGRG